MHQKDNKSDIRKLMLEAQAQVDAEREAYEARRCNSSDEKRIKDLMGVKGSQQDESESAKKKSDSLLNPNDEKIEE